MKPIKFKSVLTRSTGEYGGLYLPVPESVALKFKVEQGTRRVVCTATDGFSFQCAVLPHSKGFYIGTNKTIRDALGIDEGDKITLSIVKDESKYGMPMPKELQEVLNQDPEGDKLFHALTPGLQRSMLYSIGKRKDVDDRIQTSLILVEHLKQNDGKIVYEKLKQELKRPSF